MKKTATFPKGATSYRETAFGIIPRSKLLILELIGTRKGLEYLDKLVKRNKNTVITSSLICKLHLVSFGWIFPNWAGKFRKIQVTYSDKEAPKYFQIPELILNLCNDLKERLNNLPDSESENYIIKVAGLAAWFQHRFVVIHPFQDYNGRIARMLTILILLRLNLPPFEIQAESRSDRKRYLSALQKADEGNYSHLENLLSQALNEAFKRF